MRKRKKRDFPGGKNEAFFPKMRFLAKKWLFLGFWGHFWPFFRPLQKGLKNGAKMTPKKQGIFLVIFIIFFPRKKINIIIFFENKKFYYIKFFFLKKIMIENYESIYKFDSINNFFVTKMNFVIKNLVYRFASSKIVGGFFKTKKDSF